MLSVDEASVKNQPLPLKKLMTVPVLTAALNYACLALVDICSRAIQPTFFSTPIELGGLGLPPHHIGKILSVYGILNGILHIFFFAQTQARFGAKNTYIAGIASSLLVFVSFPVINSLARTAGANEWLLWGAVAFQVVASIFINFSYGQRFAEASIVASSDSFSFLRVHIHVHHSIRAQQGFFGHSQRARSAQRIYMPSTWSCRSQLPLLTINRPVPSLPRWKPCLLGIVGYCLLRPYGGLLPSLQDMDSPRGGRITTLMTTHIIRSFVSYIHSPLFDYHCPSIYLALAPAICRDVISLVTSFHTYIEHVTA